MPLNIFEIILCLFLLVIFLTLIFLVLAIHEVKTTLKVHVISLDDD